MSFVIVKKIPVKENTTGTVGVGLTVDVSLNPDKPFFCKSINITAGANTVINDVQVNGLSLGTGTNFDLTTLFGDEMYVESIVVNATNNGTADETVTIEAYGYTLR